MVASVILTDEQAQVFSTNPELVELRDRHGKLVASARPRLPDDEAEIIRICRERLASPQPQYTTAEVLEYLARLAERGTQC